MLTVVTESTSTPAAPDAAGAATETSAAAGGSLIDEIVRDGARRMLAAALEAEVAAYIDAYTASSTRTAVGWWCATATRRRGRC
jgi:hypothetical protein